MRVVKGHGRRPNDWVQAVAIARVRTTRITKDSGGVKGMGTYGQAFAFFRPEVLRLMTTGGVPFDCVL